MLQVWLVYSAVQRTSLPDVTLAPLRLVEISLAGRIPRCSAPRSLVAVFWRRFCANAVQEGIKGRWSEVAIGPIGDFMVLFRCGFV
jgi:hypothetical protein